MTFTYTSSVTTTAASDAVWALWCDPSTWPTWDPAVTAVRLDGPFAEGTVGTMTLVGPMEVPLVLDVVEPGPRYLDRLTIGELSIAVDHVVAPLPDGAGCEVTVTTTVEGPGADDIGPMVTQDTPVALERLTGLAESGGAGG